jgi:hypothetical protein
MHEIYAHTIFEPSAKKHLPFFSCFVKKEAPFYGEYVVIKLYWPKVCFVPQHIFIQQIIAKDLLRIQSFLLLMRYDV